MVVTDDAWERAVEAALEAQLDSAAAPRSLTLDGAVKCLHGRLPPPSLLERFQSLEHLSIANVGVSSLESFPRLRNLQRLILSDNRIAGGLEFLVAAGLDSLRDLDLSNNRIQFVEDLAPLARLRLVSLDLYECPVTRLKDYRPRVFSLIRSLKYLDKMDADENERPETDDEEDDDEDEDEDDPGSGEIEGEDRAARTVNGSAAAFSGRGAVLDVDEDDESDADDGRPGLNGFGEVLPNEDSDELDEDDDDDEDVIEVHSEEEDGVEEDEEDDDEDEDEDDEPKAGASRSTEGEIDGDDLAEEDENGEIGESDGPGLDEDCESDDDDDDEEDEDDAGEFLVQPAGRREASEDDGGDEDDVSEEEVDAGPCPARKRRRVNAVDPENDEIDGDDDEEDDLVNGVRPPSKCR
ncbi:leucine-rich repeat (LRR) family protein [Wolffia australiana]